MTRPSPANLAIIRRDYKYNGSVALSGLGMDRWSLRVAAYAGLMTDTYPPFRLDQGGTDPGAFRVAESSITIELAATDGG